MVSLSGCQIVATDYMPLKLGDRWTYSVSTPRGQTTPELVVDRALAVGRVRGFELAGPLGITRLAWSNHRLVASQLAGTGFEPPITLLDPALPDKLPDWRGEVRSPLSEGPAVATLSQEMSTTLVAGVRQPAIKSTLTLTVGEHNLKLLTWWVRGIGIAEQTQRTDGIQDVELSWLSGPSRSLTGTESASKSPK